MEQTIEQRKEILEAIEAAIQYNEKLMTNIPSVLFELKMEKREDTPEFLQQIINGINWIIEVVNATISVINEKEELVNKQSVNDAIVKLGAALKGKDDNEIADALEFAIMPALESLQAGMKKVAEK